MAEKSTNNPWKIAIPLMLTLSLVGVLTGLQIFFIAAIIPLTLLLSTYISRKPRLENIELTRKISKEAPKPGQRVKVKLKAKNNGEKTINDLRIIDQVPEQLKVDEGSPRAAFAIKPGSEKQLEYRIIAQRGKHQFQNTKAELKTARKTQTKVITPEGDDKIECKTELSQIPLRDKTTQQVGDITTNSAGSGIEFHSLREYKNSDPPSRVEWEHLAKTGKLATKNFREEKTGNIVIVLDAQKISDQRPEAGHPSATDLSAYAAARIYKTLLKTRQKPGIIILGLPLDEIEFKTDSNTIPYIEPGRSREKRRKTEKLLKKAQKTNKKNENDIKSKLYKILPPNSQTIFLSPLIDQKIVSSIITLENHGIPSTVITPDITYKDTPSATLEGIKREMRLKQLRTSTNVVNWKVDDKIDLEINKAIQKLNQRTGGA